MINSTFYFSYLLFNFRLGQLHEYCKTFTKTFAWLSFQLLVRDLKNIANRLACSLFSQQKKFEHL